VVKGVTQVPTVMSRHLASSCGACLTLPQKVARLQAQCPPTTKQGPSQLVLQLEDEVEAADCFQEQRKVLTHWHFLPD
jgi:hypothetical protein